MTLQEFFDRHPRAALGLSGGVDSAYLLYAGRKAGADIRPYFIKTAFQPAFELDDARRLCDALGEEKTFGDIKYRAFPTVKALSERDEAFFYGVGLGHRAPFIKRLADALYSGALDLESYKELSAAELKKALKRIYGVRQKVADCAILFGFHKSDCFPVDVWLEKVYRENFNGTLTDREKISEWFVQKFGEDSGFFQQYLFYYKRSLESVRTNEN